MTEDASTPTRKTLKLTPSATSTRLKRASKPDAPKPRIAAQAEPAPEGEAMKKKDFIDRVVERSGVKKRDAKPAIEATMAELADLLAAGRDLNLPPMGKLKSVKSKEVGDGAQVLTLKLRTMKDGAGQGADKTGVAEDGEDG